MKDYFEFKGIKYGIGTLVKVPRTVDLKYSSKEWLVVDSEFVGCSTFVFTNLNGSVNLYESRGHFSGKYEQYIEIIKPVYYQESEPPPQLQNIFLRTKSGSCDAHYEVCIGFIWYIVIMLIACIFKDRIGIWALATIVFFLWKTKK